MKLDTVIAITEKTNYIIFYTKEEIIKAINKDKAYFKQWDMDNKIKEFEVSSATVEWQQ